MIQLLTCAMCRHTVRTVCRRILLQSVHITPLLHVRLLNRPATSVWGLDLFLKTVKCCPVSHLLSASSCLVSLFNTPHICFNLLSHHVLSSASPAPLQTLSVFSLPPFMLLFFFFFLKRGLITYKAKAGEDNHFSSTVSWCILHRGNHTGEAARSKTNLILRFWPNLTSRR